MSGQMQEPPKRPQWRQNIFDTKVREWQNGELQYLENLTAFEAQSGPIFTRSLLEQAARQVELVRQGSSQIGQRLFSAEFKKSMDVQFVLGGGFDRQLAFQAVFEPAASLNFSKTFTMAQQNGICTPYSVHSGDYNAKFMHGVTLKPDDGVGHPTRKAAAALPEHPRLNEMVNQYEANFFASPFCKKLLSQLDSLTVKVDNIVCLALGPHVDGNGNGKVQVASFMQHLLALSISNHLAIRYEEESPSDVPHPDIPIVAFDPRYTLQDVSILGNIDPPVTVVTEPHQYLAITPSTLVLCINWPLFVPVLEVCADVCFPSGPAAFIINEIVEYPWHKEGLYDIMEARTPRVSKMLEAYDGRWIAEEAMTYPPGFRWCEGLFCYSRRE
ncbi:hypothetical protein NX059_011898 [Plenodomus lindquistii]|nr:hypothetical protein NX059_011898 [Plenodomus lindquistii]